MKRLITLIVACALLFQATIAFTDAPVAMLADSSSPATMLENTAPEFDNDGAERPQPSSAVELARTFYRDSLEQAPTSRSIVAFGLQGCITRCGLKAIGLAISL